MKSNVIIQIFFLSNLKSHKADSSVSMAHKCSRSQHFPPKGLLVHYIVQHQQILREGQSLNLIALTSVHDWYFILMTSKRKRSNYDFSKDRTLDVKFKADAIRNLIGNLNGFAISSNTIQNISFLFNLLQSLDWNHTKAPPSRVESNGSKPVLI